MHLCTIAIEPTPKCRVGNKVFKTKIFPRYRKGQICENKHTPCGYNKTLGQVARFQSIAFLIRLVVEEKTAAK